MRIRTCCQLALLLAGTAAATAGMAMPSALPASLMRTLPERAAAVAAIESGEEAINQRTLLLAPYVGPTERRRMFERELA